MTRSVQALMHPRRDTGVPAESREPWPAAGRKQAQLLLEFVRERAIGWGNLSVKNSELQSAFGYVESHPPHDRAFKRELEAEPDRMRASA